MHETVTLPFVLNVLEECWPFYRRNMGGFESEMWRRIFDFERRGNTRNMKDVS
jgi:hypothetical protein